MRSSILNVITVDPEVKCSHYEGITELYTRICLDTFMRNIGEPYSSTRQNAQPKTIELAYHRAK